MDLAKLPFVQARWYTKGTPGVRAHDWIVLHTMEMPDKGDTAMSCAHLFQSLPSTRKASAHFCIDNARAIHTVNLDDVAYGAPGANRRGIHLEHAGFAKQTAVEWTAPYNQSMLKLSAIVAGEIVKRYKIPITFLTVEQLQRGERGFTTHNVCSKAFPPNAGHWDPGPHFPMLEYLQLVRDAVEGKLQ